MNGALTNNIKAVIFDHDDTLVNTIGTKSAQHKYIAKRYYGKDLTDAEIREHWGKPLEELLCALFSTQDGQKALAYTFAHHENYPKILFPGTIPTLRYLKSQGKLIGVVTATNRYSFDHDILHHKVPAELIDFAQTADETPYHKPDPRVFEPVLGWLKSHNVRIDEVLFVGDGLTDLLAARGVGFAFMGVETGLMTAREFRQHEATSVKDVSRLRDLL